MPRPDAATGLTPQRAAAQAWLQERLGGGREQQAGVLIEDAERAGINQRTLRRAAQDLHVTTWFDGGDAWWWRIDTTPAELRAERIKRARAALVVLPREDVVRLLREVIDEQKRA